MTFSYLSARLAAGAIIKETPLTEEFDFAAYRQYYGKSAIPLFFIDEKQDLHIFTEDTRLEPQPGGRIISLAEVTEQQG